MWLSLALIDLVAPDGILTSFEVRSRDASGSVVVDRLRDILPDYVDRDGCDIGGIRIYNASSCLIWKRNSHLRTFHMNENNSASFSFQHVGIPIEQEHCGVYNLVLAPGWRFRELTKYRGAGNYPHDLGLDMKDRFDSKKRRKKRECPHTLIWDGSCRTQIVEMELIPYENAFSFLVEGKASLVATDHDRVCYVKGVESECAVQSLSNITMLDEGGKACLANALAEKADWLELKPNVFGLGINLNQIVRDSIEFFKHRVRRK